MLNPYDHEDAEPLTASVRQMLPQLQRLIDSATRRDLQIVYVNDHYGDWSAGRPELVARALDGKAPDLVEPIVPSRDCVAHINEEFAQAALEMMERNMHAQVTATAGEALELL